MPATPANDRRPRPVPELPFYEAVLEDFHAVNDLIPRQLTSDVDLVDEIGRYIVEAGGKRLRPLVVLLAGNCCGAAARGRVKLAAIIEFLHTATLLHDDVVDRSALRRGRATANALWGNAPSVLVGDFLYSRAFQMMVELGELEIMRILSEATNVIAEGEVMQLDGIGRVDMDESHYMEVIRCKTAMLFEAAAHTAAVLAGGSPARVAALQRYGRELGLAFQLVDDALDYSGATERLGKNVGDDLAEGKMTLPLIHTLRHGEPEHAGVVHEALTARDPDRFEAVATAVARAGGIDYTLARARDAARTACRQLECLPRNPYRQALTDLARFAIERDY